MRALLLCLGLILASCSADYKPKFKEGDYVKHIQSGCVGVIMMYSAFSEGKVAIQDYVCEVEHSEYKYIKKNMFCLLYTSDAADDTPCVDLGGRRIIKKIF